MYRFSLNSQLLQAPGKLHSILQMVFLGWGSLDFLHHILHHHKEQILHHRCKFGMVQASRHLYLHRTDQGVCILQWVLESKVNRVVTLYP